jgi:integrase
MTMPGGTVIEYDGKRGTVFRIKYRDADGKQVMETVGAKRDGFTRRKAEAALRDRLVKVEQHGWRKPTVIRFRDYAERWFVEGEAKRRWKPATVRAYVFVRRRLIDGFGLMPLAEIRPRHIAAWVAQCQGGASTVSRDLAILHAIFDSAEREELINGNPARRIERPKMPKRRWRLLEPAEVPVVAKAFTDARARRVFLTLTLTGLRRFEVQGLRWGHINLLEGTLRVVESKSEQGERLVALPPTLVRELSEHYATTAYKSDADYVFAHPERGTRLEVTNWYPQKFKAALLAAGITDYVRPHHDMRHTALTNLAATGASPIVVMTTAGHRSMQTTKKYVHLGGVAFRDDAHALERRLLGAQNLLPLSTDGSREDEVLARDPDEPSTEPSTRLGEREPISGDLRRSETRLAPLPD